MEDYYENLDLIDLISERHVQLRKIIEKLWNENGEIYISNSEWFILARIDQYNEPTVSCLTKSVDITRQATHKFIKSLKSKGLVEVKNVKNNKKEKYVTLTEFGKECLTKYLKVKEDLEAKIAEKIGLEQVEKLKELLRTEWDLKPL